MGFWSNGRPPRGPPPIVSRGNPVDDSPTIWLRFQRIHRLDVSKFGVLFSLLLLAAYCYAVVIRRVTVCPAAAAVLTADISDRRYCSFGLLLGSMPWHCWNYSTTLQTLAMLSHLDCQSGYGRQLRQSSPRRLSVKVRSTRKYCYVIFSMTAVARMEKYQLVIHGRLGAERWPSCPQASANGQASSTDVGRMSFNTVRRPHTLIQCR